MSPFPVGTEEGRGGHCVLFILVPESLPGLEKGKPSLAAAMLPGSASSGEPYCLSEPASAWAPAGSPVRPEPSPCSVASAPWSLPSGICQVCGIFPIPSSSARYIAHKPPTQHPHISCLLYDPWLLSLSYRKLAVVLESPRPLAGKPWNFPSKLSLATPRPQEG